uniref:(northern house mosquito) hypothetical protein n=1 Tax=Culex pipiens TaxID=7175 RepID=A0A8D8FTU9_CULPI
MLCTEDVPAEGAPERVVQQPTAVLVPLGGTQSGLVDKLHGRGKLGTRWRPPVVRRCRRRVPAVAAFVTTYSNELVFAAGARFLVLLVVRAVLPYQDDVVRLEELVARLVKHYPVLPHRWWPVRLLQQTPQGPRRFAHLDQR